MPPSALTAVLAGIASLADRHQVVIGTFGHARDGNLHPTIVVPHRDSTAEARAREAFAGIVELALRVGGTVTGEHGVGLLKRQFLRDELDDVSRRLHYEVKRVFDPGEILNPGKGLPTPS